MWILNFRLKYVYVAKIRQDLLDSSKCVTNRIHETNLLNTVVRNESTKWIFEHRRGFVLQIRIRDVWIRISSETNPNWQATNPDSKNESTFLRISYTIPASLKILLGLKMKIYNGKLRSRLMFQLGLMFDLSLLSFLSLAQIQLKHEHCSSWWMTK